MYPASLVSHVLGERDHNNSRTSAVDLIGPRYVSASSVFQLPVDFFERIRYFSRKYTNIDPILGYS